jgi:uncharacterized cupin superfamily protein
MSSFGISTAFQTDDPDFITARPEDVTLDDAPINPEWIMSGTPVARAGLHSPSTDGKASTNIWECTAGSFWWTFFNEETVVILEGSVRVTSQHGAVRVLKAGDIAYFAKNTRALWEIDTYVRKIAFCRHPYSKQVMVLRSMLGKMRRRAMPEILSPAALGTLGAMLPL